MDDKEMLKTVYNIAIIVERYFITLQYQRMYINIPVGIGTLLSISW